MAEGSRRKSEYHKKDGKTSFQPKIIETVDKQDFLDTCRTVPMSLVVMKMVDRC